MGIVLISGQLLDKAFLLVLHHYVAHTVNWPLCYLTVSVGKRHPSVT